MIPVAWPEFCLKKAFLFFENTLVATHKKETLTKVDKSVALFFYQDLIMSREKRQVLTL